MKKLLACWLSIQAKESQLNDNQLKLKKKKKNIINRYRNFNVQKEKRTS